MERTQRSMAMPAPGSAAARAGACGSVRVLRFLGLTLCCGLFAYPVLRLVRLPCAAARPLALCCGKGMCVGEAGGSQAGCCQRRNNRHSRAHVMICCVLCVQGEGSLLMLEQFTHCAASCNTSAQLAPHTPHLHLKVWRAGLGRALCCDSWRREVGVGR